MKIISNTNQIVTRGLVAFFVSLGLIIGLSAPTQAAVPASGYKKNESVECIPGVSSIYTMALSNYWKNTSHTWQRYHFKMSYDNNPWYRPYSLEIDGVKFGDWPSSWRTGTLYDGFLDMPDNDRHTFKMFYDAGNNVIQECNLRTY